MSLKTVIFRQFERPRGAVGQFAGWIMANRPSNRERSRWTVGLLGLEPGSKVMEIGCGPGNALKFCAERMDGGHITGLDHSETMVRQARQHLKTEIAAGRVTVHMGGLEHSSLHTERFDRVFSINLIQFLPDIDDGFRRIAACLSTGGLVATTYQPRPGLETAHAMAGRIREAMARTGFADIAEYELPLRSAPAICVTGRKAGLPERREP